VQGGNCSKLIDGVKMSKKAAISQVNADENAFAKARYEYCLQLYKREQERKDILEKKAQFYLSLVTLFLGALVLKVENIETIRSLLRNPQKQTATILYISSAIFLVSLAVALISILLAVHVRGYLIEHPVDLISALFSSEPGYLDANTELELYTSTAKSYALATESDRVINEHKSRWVQISSLSVFVALLSFVILYGSLFF
jgi:hypothetical protein